VSKAFTKDDAPEEPIVAPRAPLPDGVPNYVTPRGLRLLRGELAHLERQSHALDDEIEGDEDDARRRRAVLAQRLSELATRISSAQLVEHARRDATRVRFGTRVTVRGSESGDGRVVRIVGVDEADPAAGRIAFTAPLARAVMGLEVGDVAIVETPAGEDEVEVVAIDDASDAEEGDAQP
jgi:transcription elongation factor GreB